ncbi:MAG: ABC transporter permease [Chloroflexota bacterium]
MPKSPYPIYDSAQRGSPAIEELRELLRYRNLLLQMVRRDVVTRYKRSVLGIAWTMLNPLGTTLVLTIVFSEVFGAERSYAAYVLSGLMAWLFFAQTTNACMVGLIWGSGLLHRIYMPRTIFAVSAIGTGLVNLVLSIIPLLLVTIIVGIPLTPAALLLPVAVLFLAMFSLGLGLLLSSIAVHFADVTEMYQILLTAWMYLSPVIYRIELIPEKYHWIVQMNPMYYLIEYFRAFIYSGVLPSLEETLLVASISLVTLLLGWLIFARKADEFAYRV